MSTSKRVSCKQEHFTLKDMYEWLQQASGAGIPSNAIVRANVTWRGHVREIYASDAVVAQQKTEAMTFKDQMEELDQTNGGFKQ